MWVNISAKGNFVGRGQEEERPWRWGWTWYTRPSFPASRPQKSNGNLALHCENRMIPKRKKSVPLHYQFVTKQSLSKVKWVTKLTANVWLSLKIGDELIALTTSRIPLKLFNSWKTWNKNGRENTVKTKEISLQAKIVFSNHVFPTCWNRGYTPIFLHLARSTYASTLTL